MSQVLHPIEKKIINVLQKNRALTIAEIMKNTDLESDQVRRGIEWLKLKNLATVIDDKQLNYFFGPNADKALSIGLPERRLVNEIKNGHNSFELLRNALGDDFNPAIANAKKNNWIKIEKKDSSTIISLEEDTSESPEEKFLKHHETNKKNIPIKQPQEFLKTFESLQKRPGFINGDSITIKRISLTEKRRKIDLSEKVPSEAIDVEAKVPQTHAARIHPLKETINEIREIFVSLGFTEVLGNLAQSSFWNFDALFTPQDHPAREMQDTFYIKNMKAGKFASSQQITNVSRSHKSGWNYNWNISEAQRMVLRTHTTCVTIKHLADNKPDEARIFSLGRVFRNEKVSYKHLAEFNQVEGVVIGKNVTLRDLMGLQEEFYRRIGLTKIKFWPTFFPYTEPSLQSMVYNDRLEKWIELFGMGIFRPEVTKPLGITKPVLAWGGGIERIAMLKYGIDDVREFYNNNLDWLRRVTKCQ